MSEKSNDEGIDSDILSGDKVGELLAALSADPLLLDKRCSDIAHAPITLAAAWDKPKCLGALISAGADMEARDGSGMTALMWSCRMGKARSVQTLIESGAHLDSFCEAGRTALMWAASCGNAVCAQTMIDGGANLHAKDKAGFTALAIALRDESFNCARVFEAAISEQSMEAPWKRSFKLMG